MTGEHIRQAGAVTLRRADGAWRVLLCRPHDNSDAWIFPKGHLKVGETEQDAARRELREETGVVARPICEVGTATFNNGGRLYDVSYFLFEFQAQRASDERRDVAWFAPDEARARLTYPEARAILDRALESPEIEAP